MREETGPITEIRWISTGDRTLSHTDRIMIEDRCVAIVTGLGFRWNLNAYVHTAIKCRDQLQRSRNWTEQAFTRTTDILAMIEFPRPLYNTIVRQSYRGEDEEICGVLGGSFGPVTSTVSSVHQADNAADRPEVRYAIEPTEQFQLTEAIEASGDEVVGFYHSHPAGPPFPSETDRERATWPGHSYVIVALDGYPFVGSWRWNDDADRFEKEQVVLTIG